MVEVNNFATEWVILSDKLQPAIMVLPKLPQYLSIKEEKVQNTNTPGLYLSLHMM